MVEKPKCQIEGCSRNAMSHGGGRHKKLCTAHHKDKYKMPRSVAAREKGLVRASFPSNECVLCGWEGPCDAHRLLPGSEGGTYSEKNVAILCPNCHRLVHLGELSVE